MSYLPLSHIAAQLLDIFRWRSAHFPLQALDAVLCAADGAQEHAGGDAADGATDSLLQGAITSKTRATPASAPKHVLIDWLKAVNLRAYYAKQLGGDMVRPLALALADRLPTSTETLEFWGALGVGMSESSGVHTASLPYNQQSTVRVSLHWVTSGRWNLPKITAGSKCSVSIVCIVRVCGV